MLLFYFRSGRPLFYATWSAEELEEQVEQLEGWISIEPHLQSYNCSRQAGKISGNQLTVYFVIIDSVTSTYLNYELFELWTILVDGMLVTVFLQKLQMF